MKSGENKSEQAQTMLSYPRTIWEISKLALPYSGTMLIRMSGDLAGIIMLSNLGLEELAASGLFVQFISISMAAGVGIMAPVGIMAGKCYKAEEVDSVGKIYQRGVYSGTMLAVPFSAFALVSSPIFQALGQEENLSDLAQQFLRAFSPTVMAYFIQFNFEQLALATGKPLFTFGSILFERILFGFLAYGMIFGKLGMSGWGVAGLGAAYSISSWSAVIWQWLGLRFHPHFRSFQLFRPRRASDWSIVKTIWKDGSMIALLQMGEMATLSVLALLIGTLGEEPLAAYQVGMQFMAIAMMPVIVISQSLGILCSQNFGVKNMFNVKRIGNVGTIMEIVPTAIYTALAISIPKLMASIYIKDVNDPAKQELVNMARNLMIIFGISAFPDAVRFGFTGALRGFLDTQLAMWMGFLILAIATPLGFAARALGLEPEGIMIARGLAIIVATIPLGFRWHNKSHKTIEEIEADQQKPSCFGLWEKAGSGVSSLWNTTSSYFGYRGNGEEASCMELSEPSDFEENSPVV